MKPLFVCATVTMLVFGQTTVPVTLNGSGVATIPSGTFQSPLTVNPPLQLSGSALSCPGCGGGGSGTGLMPWNPAPSPPPLLSNWTLINGTGDAFSSDVTNGIQLSGSGCCAMDGLWLPVSSGAFTLTTHINAYCMAGVPSSGPRFGIFVGDTGTKKVELQYGDIAPGPTARFTINYWQTDGDSTASTPFAATPFMYTQDFWWRIQYDGTNFLFKVSPTGSDSSTWTTIATLAANSNLASAPAKVGFDIYPQAKGASCNAVLNYWSVTQP